MNNRFGAFDIILKLTLSVEKIIGLKTIKKNSSLKIYIVLPGRTLELFLTERKISC